MAVPAPVLQGIGIGQAVDQSGLAQALQHQQNLQLQKQELALRKQREDREEQQLKENRAAAGYNRFHDNYFGNAADLHTGSPTDPININLMGTILNKAAGMYAQGADDMTVSMTLMPDIAKYQKYVATAKGFESGMKTFEENAGKEKAWNMNNLRKGIEDQIFYDIDPKTGERTLKDPDKINADIPGAASRFTLEHPELAGDPEALNAYIKGYPRNTNLHDITTYDSKGVMDRKKANIDAPNYMVEDMDEKGNPILVPKYQEAADGGDKIYHDFTNKDGSVTRAPIRLLDIDEYKRIMKSPAATAVMGLAKEASGGYKDANGNALPDDSTHADLTRRAFLYDYFKDRAATKLTDFQINDKQPTQALKIQYEGTPYQRAYGREEGQQQAKMDMQDEYIKYLEKVAGVSQENKKDFFDYRQNAEKTDEASVSERIGRAKSKEVALTIAQRQIGKTLSNGDKVVGIRKNPSWNPFSADYIMTIEKDGKKEDRTIKNQSELAAYFIDNEPAEAPAAPPKAAPATRSKTTEREKINY